MTTAITANQASSPAVTKASVGIIGCGWLGSALAKQLIAEGHEVVATRSSPSNVEALRQESINTELLLLPSSPKELSRKRVFQCQQLVIAITPQLRQGRVDYPEKVKQLVAAAKHSAVVKQVILVSSSAIYNGLSAEVSETAELKLSADKVLLLHQAEQEVLAFAQTKVPSRAHILRLAGLVGENRHPGKFLAGKNRVLADGDAAVNLIHQQDAVGLLLALLKSDVESGIFNGVSETRATKRVYYQRAAKALSLAEPLFSEDSGVDNARVVSGEKAKQVLSYQFVYPDLLSWL